MSVVDCGKSCPKLMMELVDVSFEDDDEAEEDLNSYQYAYTRWIILIEDDKMSL